LAAVGLAIPATPASADGITSLTKCQPITAAGTYRLDADVAARNDCYPIGANGVTLLMDGHTIKGLSSFFTAGIRALGSGATILGPGTVTGWNDGILLLGGSGKVHGVSATGNGSGTAVDSAGNDVRGNTMDNFSYGIILGFGATGNTIIGNFAHGNGVVDLSDGNSNCDSNVWRGNDFGTANQSCIH
jgi:parallel beta-helix repeat protein